MRSHTSGPPPRSLPMTRTSAWSSARGRSARGRRAPESGWCGARGSGDTAAMRMSSRKEIYRNASYEIHVVGAPAPGWNDLYHALLRVPWWQALGVIVVGYLT